MITFCLNDFVFIMLLDLRGINIMWGVFYRFVVVPFQGGNQFVENKCKTNQTRTTGCQFELGFTEIKLKHI